MPVLRPVQEPIVGFGVSSEGVQNAVGAAAPLIQASQTLEQRGIDDKKKQEAVHYQKLLRSGADGMRSYAQEVSTLYPDLGAQIGQEAEQYATFFSDPSLSGEKAEQYASHFYESANNRIKFADEGAKKDRETKEKQERTARFQTEFVPGVEKLIQESKTKPEVVSDIATQLAKSEHAGQDYAEKFIDNLKQNRPVSEVAGVRRDALDLRESEEFQKRIRMVKKDLDTKVPIAQAFADIDKAIPGGIDGSGDIAGTGIGGKAFRKWFMSDAGSKTRAAIATLTNITLKDRSGAAVTDQELDRIMEELALSNTSTTEAFRDALRRKRANLLEEMENAEKVDPEASEELRKRGFQGADIVRKTIKSKKAASKITLKAGESITPDNVGGVDDDALERRRQELLGKRKGAKSAPQ